MKNTEFRAAYDAAAKELEALLQKQELIEARILALRKTMNALLNRLEEQGKVKETIKDGRKAWIKAEIKRGELFKAMQQHVDHEKLPDDVRALLGHPKRDSIEKLADGMRKAVTPGELKRKLEQNLGRK